MTSGRHDESSVAILFFTHVFDRTALRHLKQLKDQTADSGTLFVYCDVDGQAPPPLDIEVVRFHFPTIRQRYPRILGTTLVPGNCHLTLLEFAKRYPQFQHYWVIEYDVEFAGHWQQFFSAFAAEPADFVATHLRDRSDEPDWFWWHTVEAPSGDRPIELVRAFCPIQRISRRSLELLDAKAREGWVGHFECLVPSLLKAHGLSLLDIGGKGRYVESRWRKPVLHELRLERRRVDAFRVDALSTRDPGRALERKYALSSGEVTADGYGVIDAAAHASQG